MVYYNLDSFTCHVIHYKKWEPFLGQYWCPICEKIRKGDASFPSQKKRVFNIKNLLKRKRKNVSDS